MSREKQIEEMRKEVAKAHRFFLEDDDYESLDDYIADRLYNAGYRKQEWISVDEMLPEDMLPINYKYKTIKVLVAIKGKNGVTIRTQQRFLDYIYPDDKRTVFWTWRFSGGDVTHWMPLPEPPKMKGGE